MKNFIMIDNEILLDSSDFNTFKKIGTEGFSIYCYLLSQQGQKSYCQVNVKMIHSFMNRESDSLKDLNYNTDKKCKVGTMKDKKTIIKHLGILKINKYISFDEEKYGLNDILTIKVNKIETKNFTMISEDLFVDYIHKIGHVGWSLLYILTKLHNCDYGSCSCEGFANPTEEYLKSIIKRDVKTIRAYLYLLQDYKLIQIKPQDKVFKGIDGYGNEYWEYLPNNYIVKNRLVGNKYNLTTDNERVKE